MGNKSGPGDAELKIPDMLGSGTATLAIAQELDGNQQLIEAFIRAGRKKDLSERGLKLYDFIQTTCVDSRIKPILQVNVFFYAANTPTENLYAPMESRNGSETASIKYGTYVKNVLAEACKTIFSLVSSRTIIVIR